MKELQHFIEQYTNTSGFYETPYEPHHDPVLKIDLDLDIPNQYPRGLIYYVENYPEAHDEQHFLLVEENYVHPIYAIQVMMQRLREVYLALQDIGARLGSQSLYLDEVLGKTR